MTESAPASSGHEPPGSHPGIQLEAAGIWRFGAPEGEAFILATPEAFVEVCQ